MNKFAPKADFLKRRAVSLRRSGYCSNEIAKMLGVSQYTARGWTDPEFKERRAIREKLREAERAAAIRWSCPALPTLAHVPGIILTDRSRYRMRSA